MSRLGRVTDFVQDSLRVQSQVLPPLAAARCGSSPGRRSKLADCRSSALIMNHQSDPYSFLFSKRAQGLTSSVIREILKVTQQPEVISFAGGIPSSLSFPVDAFKVSFDRVLTQNGSAALQYGPTEGVPGLRAWVAESLSTPGDQVPIDEILIVSGSQQGLDLLGKVLIDEGSKVLVESPTYLGAIQSFSLFQPEFVSVPTDDDGLIPEKLERRDGQGRAPHLHLAELPESNRAHPDDFAAG